MESLKSARRQLSLLVVLAIVICFSTVRIHDVSRDSWDSEYWAFCLWLLKGPERSAVNEWHSLCQAQLLDSTGSALLIPPVLDLFTPFGIATITFYRKFPGGEEPSSVRVDDFSYRRTWFHELPRELQPGTTRGPSDIIDSVHLEQNLRSLCAKYEISYDGGDVAGTFFDLERQIQEQQTTLPQIPGLNIPLKHGIHVFLAVFLFVWLNALSRLMAASAHIRDASDVEWVVLDGRMFWEVILAWLWVGIHGVLPVIVMFCFWKINLPRIVRFVDYSSAYLDLVRVAGFGIAGAAGCLMIYTLGRLRYRYMKRSRVAERPFSPRVRKRRG